MKDAVELRGGHSSGQFSDTERQQTQDARRLANRVSEFELDFLTGTEAGSQSVLADAWREIDQQFGLRFRKGASGDVWLVHRKDLFSGPVQQEWRKVIDGVGGKFADRGILRVTGFAPKVQSNLTILVSHWLTDKTDGNSADGPGNQKLARALSVLGREFGRGRNLCFYGADQNRSEREVKGILLNAPFVTLAQDTGRIQNTGHGPIDCLARFKGDRRVSGKSWNVLDDWEFPLHSDHFYCEGSWEVQLLH